MRDGTRIMVASWSKEAGFKSEVYEIPYDDYDRYESLPDACKCDEIREEFEAYKEWKKSLRVVEKLEKQLERIHRRGKCLNF